MKPKYFPVFFALAVIFSSCVHKVKVVPQAGAGEFPANVAAIMQSKCAISGCHNQASYGNADSLLLDSWTHLFQGGGSGAVVIPYSTAYSTLLYYVNTDPSLGPIYAPLMPVSLPGQTLAPLTAAEYNTLYTWIKNGAPDAAGNIAFAADPDTRQKSYLIHGNCDKIIVVIDSKTGLAMRVIPIGDSSNGESGHCVRVSPDGMYAYASVIGYNLFVKIDTRTDKAIASIDLTAAQSLYASAGSNAWADMVISPTGDSVLLCDFAGIGCALLINTQTMTVINGWPTLVNPHAPAANATFDTFFVTAQYGNTLYKLSNRYIGYMSVNGAQHSTQASIGSFQPDPHFIISSPDHSQLFVTCQDQNNVKILNAYTGALIDSIAVGAFPQDMAISTKYPYLFVTCKNDPVTNGLGSVYVINYKTWQIVQVLKDQYYAPHGVTVDDQDGLFYIASSNFGGVSHHPTTCGSPNGWYNAYYLNTLLPAFSDKRFSIFSDPYAMDTRFK